MMATYAADWEYDDWEVWIHRAPNSRKYHVYDGDGDTICRRYCVLVGPHMNGHGTGQKWATVDTDDPEICATCRKKIAEKRIR